MLQLWEFGFFDTRWKSREQANARLNALMESAAGRLMTLAKNLFADLQKKIEADGGMYGPRKGFLEDYCARVGLIL